MTNSDEDIVRLMSAAQFADARTKERIRARVLASRRPRLPGGRLAALPVALAILLAVFFLPKKPARHAAYIDLGARYYSAQDLRMALGGGL